VFIEPFNKIQQTNIWSLFTYMIFFCIIFDTSGVYGNLLNNTTSPFETKTNIDYYIWKILNMSQPEPTGYINTEYLFSIQKYMQTEIMLYSLTWSI